MIGRWLILLLWLLPLPAAAQTLAGSWALRLEGSIIMRWDLERDGDSWTGAWTKPDSFRSDGKRFSNIEMPAVTREADRGQAIGDWAELTFDSPSEGDEPDVFRFRLLSADRAEMIYAGTGLPPFALERVAADAILGPFADGRVYGSSSPAASRPSPRASQPARAPRPAPSPADDQPAQGPPAMIGR